MLMSHEVEVWCRHLVWGSLLWLGCRMLSPRAVMSEAAKIPLTLGVERATCTDKLGQWLCQCYLDRGKLKGPLPVFHTRAAWVREQHTGHDTDEDRLYWSRCLGSKDAPGAPTSAHLVSRPGSTSSSNFLFLNTLGGSDGSGGWVPATHPCGRLGLSSRLLASAWLNFCHISSQGLNCVSSL